MKKLASALIASGLVLSSFVAEAQEGVITANVSLATDYIYRGVSQTSGGPAIQGGFDYEHESGFYVGTWASSITFNDSIELNYYSGFSGNLTDSLEFDVGALYYDYPGAEDDDFLEVYAGLSYAGVTATAAYSDDFFAGVGKAFYYTLAYGFNITDNIQLGLHYGYSDFDENVWDDEDSYSDFRISLGGSFAGADLSLTWTDTDLSSSDCGSSDDCASTLTFAVSKSF